MSEILSLVYIVIFVLQIILLVKAFRSKNKKIWVALLVLELVSTFVAIGCKEYYNSLPGYGFMPGLTYMGEVLFSFFASILYGANFLVSACIFIATEEKKRSMNPLFAIVFFLLCVVGIIFGELLAFLWC